MCTPVEGVHVPPTPGFLLSVAFVAIESSWWAHTFLGHCPGRWINIKSFFSQYFFPVAQKHKHYGVTSRHLHLWMLMGFLCSKRTLFLVLSLNSSLCRWNSSRLVDASGAQSIEYYSIQAEYFSHINIYKFDIKINTGGSSVKAVVHVLWFTWGPLCWAQFCPGCSFCAGVF